MFETLNNCFKFGLGDNQSDEFDSTDRFFIIYVVQKISKVEAEDSPLSFD